MENRYILIKDLNGKISVTVDKNKVKKEDIAVNIGRFVYDGYTAEHVTKEEYLTATKGLNLSPF